MSYWSVKTQNLSSLDSFGLGNTIGGNSVGEFYELEPGVVLDIVLDKDHPIFQQHPNLQTNIDVDRWPGDFQNKKPLGGEIDFTWIGRALVRLIYSTPNVKKEQLIWAYPMDSSISEYPVINEVVMVMQYRGKFFYGRKLNLRNLPNESVDFSVNSIISGKGNTELFTDEPYQGKVSQTSVIASKGYKGIAGKYYQINNRVRRIKRYEGDLVFESRFGQSIRFGAYDENRKNDSGIENSDYSNGGGNPMIIIRNRQRKLLKKDDVLTLNSSPNPAEVIGTSEEKNAGGFIKEDINHDGSTIAITAGQTESAWKTTCFKKLFGVAEEVPSFNNKGFKYPILNGDQVIINTDRLIFSSRYGETLHYAKKRYGIITDNEYTVDAHQQIVLTTNTKTVINSPAIYLGEYDTTDEPVLLGQTTVNWLYDLCEWIKAHTHWYHHSHPHAGHETPEQTQFSVQIAQLDVLQKRLEKLLSRRVFVTGGGFAPGKNGGNITGGSQPLQIDINNGKGIPGGWKGTNKR